MTIDERLDRLVERHEALAQTVQMLADSVHAHDEYFKKHETYLTDLMEGTARLLHVAEIHERRLARLEGQDD